MSAHLVLRSAFRGPLVSGRLQKLVLFIVSEIAILSGYHQDSHLHSPALLLSSALLSIIPLLTLLFFISTKTPREADILAPRPYNYFITCKQP